MESIVQNDKECYVCHTRYNMHCHHVFFGSGYRKLSEEYGCKVWLCGHHHNMSKDGVHFNKSLDRMIKRETQMAFEQIHGHAKYMQVFCRNYLEPEEWNELI